MHRETKGYRKDATAPHITLRPQLGGHRQCGLAICTFHLGFSLEQLQVGLSALERWGLFPFRDNHLGAVVGRPVHQGTNPVGLQRSVGVRGQETAQCQGVSQVIVQPEGLSALCKYHRHPIVNGLEQLIRLGGDNRAGADHIPLRVLPCVPAKAKGSRDFITIRIGILEFPDRRHS